MKRAKVFILGAVFVAVISGTFSAILTVVRSGSNQGVHIDGVSGQPRLRLARPVSRNPATSIESASCADSRLDRFSPLLALDAPMPVAEAIVDSIQHTMCDEDCSALLDVTSSVPDNEIRYWLLSLIRDGGVRTDPLVLVHHLLSPASDPPLRSVIADALIESADAPAVEAMLAAHKSGVSEELAAEIERVIAEMTSAASEDSICRYVQSLSLGTEDRLGCAALSGLAAMGTKRGVLLLVSRADQAAQADVPDDAVMLVRKLKSPESLRVLVDRLFDESQPLSEGTRLAMIQALGNSSEPGMRDVLAELRRNGSILESREAAHSIVRGAFR
ncbi:MAG: hypothetical protein JNK58_08875 [Phycisphaerae bacterium]|nr:hypothetical protein [Phycisphaerae bacterium]